MVLRIKFGWGKDFSSKPEWFVSIGKVDVVVKEPKGSSKDGKLRVIVKRDKRVEEATVLKSQVPALLNSLAENEEDLADLAKFCVNL